MSQDVPVYLDEIGRAAASDSVTIQPQVSGKVMSRNFVDGAEIHKGQSLFQIDPRPFEAALAQAKAALQQSKAAAEYARLDYSFVQNLQGTNAVSQEAYLQKKNAVDVNNAQVAAAEAQVETAQLNLEYCKIDSPLDGRAGQRLVDPGNVVNAAGIGAGTEMLVVQKIDPIYADFTVTEAELQRVQFFMARGTLDVRVETPAATRRRLPRRRTRPRSGLPPKRPPSPPPGPGSMSPPTRRAPS